jgi:hypothetical protein
MRDGNDTVPAASGASGMSDLAAHVAMVHTLAAPLAGTGKLIVASFGEDPATGKPLSPKVEHYQIGDEAGMVRGIERLARDQHRNVYVPLAVMSLDLAPSKKGFEGDIIGVLGLVADFDDDDAENYASRLVVTAPYVLKTSAGRFQAFLPFDQPASVAEAKPVAKALKEAARCDHVIADMSHVWRVPDTLNWPNKKKVAGGRDLEPQPVQVVEPWNGSFIALDELRAAVPVEQATTEAVLNPSAQPADTSELPAGLVERMNTAPPAGQRSENAHFVICALVERGWTDDRIVAEIQRYPNGVGERYVGREKDLRAEVARVRPKAKGDRRQERSRHQHAGASAPFEKQSKASAREEEEWPDPGSLAPLVPPAPPFPMAALPQVIRDFVDDEADRMQAPVDLLAIPVLIMLAGCIGKDAVIRPKAHDDWAERACLWGMVIQPPGSMKSAAIAKATAPLRHIEARWRKEDAQKHAEWSELKDEALLREKVWQQECTQLMKKPKGGCDAELPPKPRAVDELPEEPKPRRLVAQDVTIEKLGDLMIESRGLSLVRDELSGWVLNMSRYNTGSDRQFYLEAYSGGAFAIDRIRRGELYIPDVYINIVGGIQPSVAKNLFSIRDGSDDGFFDRFGLIAFPDLPDDWELVDRWPETGPRQAVNAIADKLASADWAATLHTDADVEAGRAKPYGRFSPAAQDTFNAWLTEHMRGMKSAVETPIVGFNSKARGLLGRLALVIHLTAWAAGDESNPCTVSELSLGPALAILETYLVPMWRRVMAAFSKAPVVDSAHRIAEHIRKKGLDGIRVADITKLEWPHLKDRKAVEDALHYLVDRDWLAEPQPVSGARGRPSATYMVNPKVHLMSGDDHG